MKTRLGSFCGRAFEAMLLLTLFITPLIFSPFFVRVFVVPKSFAFQLGTMLSALLFLCSILFYHELRFAVFKTRHKIFLLFSFAFLVLLFLSTFFAEVPAISLWGSYFRMQGFIAFVHYFLFALLVFIYVQQNDKNPDKLLVTVIASATLASIYAIAQKFGYDLIQWNDGELMGRVFGPFSNPTSLGQFLGMTIPLTLATIVSFRWRLVSFLAFAVQFTALIFSQSRAATLGLTVSVLFFIYFATKVKQRKGIFKTIIGLLVLASLVFGAANLYSDSDFVKKTPLLNRLQYTEQNLRSVNVRSALWKSSMQLAWQRPIFGFGADSFAYIYPRYKSQDLNILEDASSSPDRTHNELLDMAIFYGLPALAIYLVLFGTALYVAYYFIKKHRTFHNIAIIIGCGSSLISYFVANLFGFSLTPHFMLLAVLFALIIGFTAMKQSEKRIEPDFTFHKISGSMSLAAFVVATGLFVFSIYLPPAKADLLHKKALVLFNSPNASALEVLNPMEEATRTMPMYTDYAKSYASLALIYLEDEKLPENSRAKLRETTADLLVDANIRIPLDSYVYVYTGMLEGLIASQERSVQRLNNSLWHFRRAIDLDPNNPDIYLQFGNVFYDNAKFSSAIEQYEKYLSQLPEYWKWKDTGDKSDYEKQLKRIFYAQNPEFDQVLIQMGRSFASVGNFEKAIYHLEFANDNMFEKYVVLGDVYKFSDQISKAIVSYKKALELSPDNPAIIEALDEARKYSGGGSEPVVRRRGR